MNEPLSSAEIKRLTNTAQVVRIKIIEMLARAGSGHPAGALGMTDIFTALYFKLLKHRPDQPDWDQRDYLLLSNGHICPVLYVCLAVAGYFPVEKLTQLRQIDSPLQGHPKLSSLPGVEITSGSLGQGLSQACGLALALKHDQKNNHIYCLMSDGEQQEGQTWEAYMLAAKYQLINLTAIIDRNMIQIGGRTEQIMPLENLVAKLKSFGWQTLAIDGHNLNNIAAAVSEAKSDNAPTAIIANTIPGKGADLMEHDHRWHGKAPTLEQAQQIIRNLASKP